MPRSLKTRQQSLAVPSLVSRSLAVIYIAGGVMLRLTSLVIVMLLLVALMTAMLCQYSKDLVTPLLPSWVTAILHHQGA